MTRATLLILLWLAVPARAALGPAPAAGQGDPEPVETSFWTPHYLVDYGLTASGLLLGMFVELTPRDRARWGPAFDPANPSAILAAEHARLLGGPYTPRQDWTMSDGLVLGMAIGHVLVIPVHELAAARVTGRPTSAHRLHNAVLAAGEATAATAGVVMLTKAATGRLRPDFQDRVRHVYCSLPDPAGIDCQGVDPDRLFPDPRPPSPSWSTVAKASRPATPPPAWSSPPTSLSTSADPGSGAKRPRRPAEPGALPPWPSSWASAPYQASPARRPWTASTTPATWWSAASWAWPWVASSTGSTSTLPGSHGRGTGSPGIGPPTRRKRASRTSGSSPPREGSASRPAGAPDDLRVARSPQSGWRTRARGDISAALRDPRLAPSSRADNVDGIHLGMGPIRLLGA
jgi:hypothetical protein